jgi:hypothetical protein
MSDAKIVNMAVCEYQLIEVGRDGGKLECDKGGTGVLCEQYNLIVSSVLYVT